MHVLVLYVIAAFLLGSIPFGRLIGLFAGHIDVRKAGSGNIGATNVARQLGLKWGLLTLALDMLKGMVPVLAAEWWSPLETTGLAGGLVGLGALAGHQFSVFQTFSGGKGVATALGVFLAISPVACLVGLGVFFLLVLKWRYVSLASLGSAVSMPPALLALGFPWPVAACALAAAGLICLRHRENIRRLIEGREPKWGEKKSSKVL